MQENAMRRLFAMILCLAVTAGVSAQPGSAKGASLLAVNGVEFDRERLEQLPQSGFETGTPWTTGVSRFDGPLLRDVLTVAGTRGTKVTAVALNDYKVIIPLEDLDRYRVIVAIKRNGEYMPVRDKGPLWIVYPLDSDSNLQSPIIHARMIWQLKTITVD
jgi:hypothetical protein